MSITRDTTLTYELERMEIESSGACIAKMVTRAQGGAIASIDVYLSAEECAPIWQSVPEQPLPRMQDLQAQLYALLQAKGLIPPP